ncbi:hypothetical protein FAIPA1_50070 [Frankia sp. AiPs1]
MWLVLGVTRLTGVTTNGGSPGPLPRPAVEPTDGQRAARPRPRTSGCSPRRLGESAPDLRR